ncbi:heavy metal sensor histidine kinase [Allopusillimonas soli]|uniref:Sensor protein n=1 Tax=Allopusillimonas soli TaxID=659016 RepID=A0A853FBD6_9BURK|nr:heavy metal sensor histidine kinase [Allopusillimonas soli]NYT37403.1 heavy metal sensor histidine kinase [Allopusillimonas soli]TEA74615.1 heavy metal sensor histidine kinase [Allopusillimonas soli]
MKRWTLRSLTVQTTLFFALISCLVVSALGLYLYSSAKHALEVRADYTLVGRVDRFRNLLHDLYNVRQMEERPAIFESMLGNERDVRIFQRMGEDPFIQVNPDHMPPPSMTPVPVGHELTIESLHPGTRADGIRVRWVSALAKIGDQGGVVKITAAYVMTQESQMLAAYRLRVMGAIVLAVLLSTLMGFMLLKRGLKPLGIMSRRAARITPSNLTLRLPENDAPSELLQLATACNAMLDRLQAGYEHLSQFSADLAHEIRTPVNILMGQTQVALGQSRSHAEYEQLLESNLEELTRLAHIVENILFLSRTDHDTTAVDRQPLDLSDEMEKIADYFEGLAQERDMYFDVAATGTAHANAIMWRRAVNNLVINAIRHGEAGTCIRLRAEAEPSGATVTVENHGQPLSQNEIDRMFRRFYRGDKSRTRYTESNGLGLAIVTAIMAIHGGSADARAFDDGRIRFCLKFPTST